MIPVWLRSVFDECASCSLDSNEDRARLAAAIVRKLGEVPIAAAVSAMAYSYLGHLEPKDRAHAAAVLGADSAASIAMLLER